MTREDAIEWIQEEKASFERAPDLNGCPMTECWQKAIDVYEMAISAIRQQETVTKCNDLFDEDGGEILNDETVTDRHQMTNAQKIRAMSDEELAEFLIDLADDGNLRIREWLQQPADVDDHSICGATNLPCIRCNPGGCDNRKEGAD